MLFQGGLQYFSILLIFYFDKCFAGDILKAEFTASVPGASKTAECNFTLEFTDVELLKTSTVKCEKNKQMTVNSFEFNQTSFIHNSVHTLGWKLSPVVFYR